MAKVGVLDEIIMQGWIVLCDGIISFGDAIGPVAVGNEMMVIVFKVE